MLTIAATILIMYLLGGFKFIWSIIGVIVAHTILVPLIGSTAFFYSLACITIIVLLLREEKRNKLLTRQ